MAAEVAGSSPVSHPSTSSGFYYYNLSMPWAFYILLCNRKTFYVGITGNLDRRLRDHQRGYNLATKKYSDIKLVYTEKHDSRLSAEARERQVKGWTKAKKNALVQGDTKLLVALSKTRSLSKDVC